MKSPNTKTPGQHSRNKCQVRNKDISNIQIMYRFLSIKWVHTDVLNKKFTRAGGGSEGGGKALQNNKYHIYHTHSHTRLCNCMLKFAIQITCHVLTCRIQGYTFNQARTGNCPGAHYNPASCGCGGHIVFYIITVIWVFTFSHSLASRGYQNTTVWPQATLDYTQNFKGCKIIY